MVRIPPDPYLPGHGDVRYRVTHYDLTLDYRLATNRLDAVATLHVTALQVTDVLRFDLSGLHVAKVKVNQTKPKKVTHKDRALVVKLAQPLLAGASATVEIAYSGKPGPVAGVHGSAGWEELTDGVLVASQPYGAPSWFPCNDRADHKATFTISVAADPDYTVVATGRPTGTVLRGGRRVWTFHEDEPTAPYLVSLVIGRLVEQPLPGAGERVLVVRPRLLPSVSASPVGLLPQMLGTLEEWFGPYPFARFTAVVVDEDLEIPLEAQAMASFGTNHLDNGWENERLVVHELAHQWFGNSVTATLLKDIWLHEGFACYTEWLWSERRSLGTADQRAAHHWGVLAREEQPTPLSDPGMRNMFDDWIYKRGALTLHALRAAVGDDAFFAICRSWTATHAGGVATTEDFRTLAAQHTTADLQPVFDAWLDATDLPPCPVVAP